ncbi:type I polyketide synthase [Streptomyces qinglanensis]|uniref:Polyketide-type polyunsaturated fatty acid synthase PfaA n=1 Tax=Streptomyces qinglanensis TaxID=943816 RepID=A0A1H9TG37_9ACTN|nr:type I polyketide synthase [Streptomyces qinglanensis]SER96007.1 polyketide-type polyunsaturated fatty acid synthase PfaA [Streptomyces qinglanensis]
MTDPLSFRMAHRPVAVVGLAGMFPQAHDLREFWHNVVTGRDCITDVPASAWSVEDHYDPDFRAKDKTYARRGGFLPHVLFDPAEFAIPPAAVDSIGLVQLLSLRVAGEVLKDARCPESAWYDPARTGVVLGVCGQNSSMFPLSSRLAAPAVERAARGCGVAEATAQEIARRFAEESPEWTEDSFPGVLANVVAGRIANRFDLGAANYTVDAACASSLAALRAAVSELLEHRADLMITGGCDADNSVNTFLCFSKTPALSPTGTVRPFDSEADGTLLGEGVAMLALKRLADAERDGDRVYAVLRGLGSSSDGRVGSIYAPNSEGQLAALRGAYTDAEVAPAAIGLIEAHGTGTRVGDAAELRALSTALATEDAVAPVAVGSVKSQIGHTKAAAGAAGLIKTALALHHRLLPPTINVGTPNDATRGTGLYINTRARPWLREPHRALRRGGVSAFGFGGVNYHAVLEEYEPSETELRTLHPTPQALLWHAPDPAELLARLRAGAPAEPDCPVPADHARIGLVARDPAERARLVATAAAHLAEAGDAAEWALEDQVYYRRRALPPGTSSAVLFAGQGSQYPEMGLDALLSVPPVRRMFDAANSSWEEGRRSLARVVFPEPGGVFPEPGGPAHEEDLLRTTAYAQSAVGALAMGQYAYLHELGFRPEAALGHSSGEVTALWAAGCLSADDCLRLTRARGRAMQPPPDMPDPGAMAALRLSDQQWTARAERHPDLALCNINAPDEVVVGGPSAAVGALVDECLRDGGPVATRLPVAAAFHTSFVAHAVPVFAEVLSSTAFRPPALRVLADSPGARYGNGPDADREVLAQQIVRPVDFAGRVRELFESGVRVFVECGPRQILGRLVPRILPGEAVEVVSGDGGPGTNSAAALKQAALRLAVLGFDVRDVNRYDSPHPDPRPAPSPVARTLEGPHFAVLARREAQEASTAQEPRTRTPRPSEPAEPSDGTLPAPRPAAADASGTGLLRAATAQLDLHSAFLAGQMEASRSLAGALEHAGQSPDASFVACVEAIRDHSRALLSTHVRSQEILLEMVRDGAPGGPAATDGTAGLAPAPPTQRTGPDARPAPPAPAAADPEGLRDTPAAAPPFESAPQPVSPRAEADRSAAETGPGTESGPAAESESAGESGPAADQGLPSDRLQVERILRDMVAEKTGYPVEMVDPALDVQTELGIDSLKQVEIASEAWRRYPSLPREEIYRFAQARTIGELAELLTAATPRAPGAGRPAAVPSGRASLGLRPLAAVDTLVDAYGSRPVAAVVEDGSPLAHALVTALEADGWSVHRIVVPGAPAPSEGAHRLRDRGEEALREARDRLLSPDGRLDLCVLVEGSGQVHHAQDATDRLRHSVLVAKHLVPALKASVSQGRRGAFVTVTRLDGALGLAGCGGEPGAALLGGLGGLTKALGVEEPDLFCRTVDLAPGTAAEEAAARVLGEINDVRRVPEVAWNGTLRRAPALSAEPWGLLPSSGEVPGELDQDEVFLVTGGARGITAWCVTALAAHRPCRFVLLGRTPLADVPAWAAGLDSFPDLRAACAARTDGDADAWAQKLQGQRELHGTLAALRETGARAEYVSADVTDPEAVRSALAPYTEQITGIIHGAGVLADQPLPEKTPQDIERVVATKLTGLANVLEALDADRLRRLILFTSVSGIHGNGRQTDYAMANESLNRLACAWKAARPDVHVAALAWGPWQGGMATEHTQEFFRQLGVPLLSREEGCASFLEQFSPRLRQDPVAVIGPLSPVLAPVALPADGAVVRRTLTGLGSEPVLRDHTIGEHPVLPMTAAIGWCVFTVEQTAPGRRVTEVHDFRVRKGLVLDAARPEHARVVVRPGSEGSTAVAVHDDEPTPAPWYEGSFVTGAAGAAPLAGPPSSPPSAAHGLHPAYDEGFLFHGPSLRGLGQVLQENDTRLTVRALMPDTVLADGAYAGIGYSPALADLLLQAAALLGRRITGHRCLPVGVRKAELFHPLPDNEPFDIAVELQENSPLELLCTVTATGPGGTVLQRWSGLRGIVAAPQLGSRAAWPAPGA